MINHFLCTNFVSVVPHLQNQDFFSDLNEVLCSLMAVFLVGETINQSEPCGTENYSVGAVVHVVIQLWKNYAITTLYN